MKTKNSYFFALIFIVIMGSCSKPKYYTAPDFNSRTANHKTVAILPVEMVMTGKKPDKMTEADIKVQEENESLAFQMSLYNNILKNSTSRKRGTIYISFQPFEKTRDILKEQNIGIRESWSMDPQKLAQILGVDAVVKTKVQKNRYMSDLASYGMGVATGIVAQNFGLLGIGVMAAAGATTKTNDIDAQCTLHNGADGIALWKDMYKASADWSRPANEIIENLTNNFGRNFPYRKKG